MERVYAYLIFALIYATLIALPFVGLSLQPAVLGWLDRRTQRRRRRRGRCYDVG